MGEIGLGVGQLVVFVFFLDQFFLIHNLDPLYQAVKFGLFFLDFQHVWDRFHFPFDVRKGPYFVQGVPHFDVFEAVFHSLEEGLTRHLLYFLLHNLNFFPKSGLLGCLRNRIGIAFADFDLLGQVRERPWPLQRALLIFKNFNWLDFNSLISNFFHRNRAYHLFGNYFGLGCYWLLNFLRLHFGRYFDIYVLFFNRFHGFELPEAFLQHVFGLNFVVKFQNTLIFEWVFVHSLVNHDQWQECLSQFFLIESIKSEVERFSVGRLGDHDCELSGCFLEILVRSIDYFLHRLPLYPLFPLLEPHPHLTHRTPTDHDLDTHFHHFLSLFGVFVDFERIEKFMKSELLGVWVLEVGFESGENVKELEFEGLLQQALDLPPPQLQHESFVLLSEFVNIHYWLYNI